jgi:hypothetical protein
MIAEIEQRATTGGTAPSVSGALLLRRHITPDIELEQRVLPFDRAGRRCCADDPWAVHTWATSSNVGTTRQDRQP